MQQFLVTNDLRFIQDQYAKELFNKKEGIQNLFERDAKIIHSNNCDHYTQIGEAQTSNQFIFDLSGEIFAVPLSWANKNLVKLLSSATVNNACIVEALEVNNLIITATSEDCPIN